jgi:PBP1b-binding outer membrane lipoprotein LpoB
MSIRRVTAVGAIALLGVGVLAGCSSSSGSSESSSAASAAASAAGSGAAQLPAPVIVTPGQTTASMKVGEFLDIVVDKPAGTTIDVDKPDILEITQAHEDGGAVFNPGAKALAPGTAVITVTNPNSSTYDITVTVTG